MLTTYPLQAKRKYEWKKDYDDAFQSNFHSFPSNSKIGAPVYLIISPFLICSLQLRIDLLAVKLKWKFVLFLFYRTTGGEEMNLRT